MPRFWEASPRINLQRMKPLHNYTLTLADVAAHYDLSERTVWNRVKDGSLSAVQVKGDWHCSWTDVWAAEKGPVPGGKRAALYKEVLMSKKALAAEWEVSVRTVERWIGDGLPTRNVFGSVRVAPIDAKEWTRQNFVFAGDAA